MLSFITIHFTNGEKTIFYTVNNTFPDRYVDVQIYILTKGRKGNNSMNVSFARNRRSS